MKTKTINLYFFDELSEEAKQKAVENLYDINVDYNWWDSTYDDAEDVGLKITSFDTYRGNINGNITTSINDVCDKIIENHGISCETYKTAKDYLAQYDALVEKFSDGIDIDEVEEGNEYDFDAECNELEDDFLKAILEDYLVLLRQEYEYLTSEEAIIETIRTNQYTFTKDGKLEN